MKKLGKFEIIEKVGQGAMGVVYKARDPFIDRIVALKTLTTGLSDDANLLRRFYSEARSAGGLQHPNIVTIYELGHEGDTPFIAMQFLNGDSLDKIIDRRPDLPLSQKIGFIVYVCRALEYAHKQNPPVVHRDIKPGNVMVTLEGTVMVVDFGIARLGEGTRSQSAGMLIGTLGYMSPQLFRNGTADARSDIWATGVMFYELLAYRRPFEGDNAAALMSNIILEKPRSIAEASPGTPEDVRAVVERMLAKEADARYQSMEEVILELEPVWRRLQQAEVATLLEKSQPPFEAGDLETAKAKVSQVIQIDPSNTQAKSLLEKNNAEVRRKQIVPQLMARVEKAQQLLAGGRAEDAKVEAEAALKLDSTFQPARELFGHAQASIERAHNITQALRASKQRMAEGALTDAELQLDKVLGLEPGNAPAREQLKQIREERAKRERRKQRDEALHRGRTLWTNLQYEECISLLLTAQKEFPGDSEIAKLLESARQDQADQQRQSLLTEARNLLSTQRYDDALRTLDRLFERFPSDPATKNLRTHALQGRDQQRRDHRLAEEKSRLRALVKDGKYQDAIAQAAKLSREFPDDFELAELLDFARTELSQLEQKRRLEQFAKQIQLALKESRFPEAIRAAEKALLEFPKNLDLLILLDRAKKEQDEKEKHELLKQRLREVERLMDRQELTDAIDLARQTLATVGQDSRISGALLKAEREFEFREQHKGRQNETVQMARTLVDAGKFADATSILNDAIGTKLLPANDPRLMQLLNDIDAGKQPPPPPSAAAAAASGAPSATFIGSPISSTPSADPGKDYVYQQGASLPPVPTPVEQSAAPAASISTSAVTQPVVPPFSPVLPQEKKPQRGPDKSTRRKESAPSAPPAQPPAEAPRPFESATLPVQPPVFEPPAAPHRQTPSQTADAFFPEISAPPISKPSPRPLWKNPLVLGGLGLAIAIGVSAAVYLTWPAKQTKQQSESRPAEFPSAPNGQAPQTEPLPNPTLETPAPPSQVTAQNLVSQAEEFARRGDWSRAKSSFQGAMQASDANDNLRNRAAQGVQAAQRHLDELSRLKDANDTLNRGDRPRARMLYQEVVNMNLDHAAEAANLIKRIDSEVVHAAGRQLFDGLKQELRNARAAGNASTLQSLRPQFQKIAQEGAEYSAEARQIADNEIPAALSEMDEKFKRNQEEQRWTQKAADYKTAIDAKNRGALASLKDQLQPFLSGQHSAEARQYITRINEILSSAPPLPTQPVSNPSMQPSSLGSGGFDEAKIRDLFNSLSKVFDDRNITELKSLWPQIDAATLDAYRRSFEDKGLKSLRRRYEVSNVNVKGDSATASGIWTGVHMKNGRLLQNDQVPWTATLRKIDGRWLIAKLE